MSQLAGISGFLPHGVDFRWHAGMLALHVLPDAIMAATYFAIPIGIAVFIRKRRDLELHYKVWAHLFATFIAACGLTQVAGIVVIWLPLYLAEGVLKVVTAGLAIATVTTIPFLIPRLLRIPSQKAWEAEIAVHKGTLVELGLARARLAGTTHEPASQLPVGQSPERSMQTFVDTLEKRVEDRARDRDRFWRMSQDMMVVSDAQGRWQSVNPALHAILGWNSDDVIGKTSTWMQNPGDTEVPEVALASLGADAHAYGYENRLRHRDGAYHWFAWQSASSDGLFYSVGREITGQKAAADSLRQTEEQLRQSQKMEALGELTGGLAHDFNNLLTTMIISLSLLKTRIEEGRTNDLERYVTSARATAEKGAELTHRLLAFARREMLDPTPVDTGGLIASLEELVRCSVGPEISVRFVPAGRLWATRIDKNQFENAILNLCINARDAMPSGGEIRVEAGNMTLDDGAASELDLLAGDYVQLSVSDQGVGMSPETRQKAFDPFYTTKPAGAGTGLGLSMVYSFAHQSGGQARIDSEVGRGTTVSLYLPRYAGDLVVSRGPVQEVLMPPDGHGQMVLVVEDDQTVLRLVREVLEDIGFSVIGVTDGPAAMKILRSNTSIDLLVSDIGLPSMNGWQVAEAARRKRPKLKVLFITGYGEAVKPSRAQLELDIGILAKPFTPDALRGRVSALVASE